MREPAARRIRGRGRGDRFDLPSRQGSWVTPLGSRRAIGSPLSLPAQLTFGGATTACHSFAMSRRAPTSPLADALARVGDRWTLLVVAELLGGLLGLGVALLVYPSAAQVADDVVVRQRADDGDEEQA